MVPFTHPRGQIVINKFFIILYLAVSKVSLSPSLKFLNSISSESTVCYSQFLYKIMCYTFFLSKSMKNHNKYINVLYIQFPFFLLIDLDECLHKNGGCNQICINRPGLYQCDCRKGYTLGWTELLCSGKCLL